MDNQNNLIPTEPEPIQYQPQPMAPQMALEQPPVAQAPFTVPEAPKKSKKKLIIIIAIIVSLLLIGGGLLYFLVINKPATSSNDNLSQTYKSSNYDDYSLTIDGSEIKLPMKLSDFLAMGFDAMNAYYKDNYDLTKELLKENINPHETLRTGNGGLGLAFVGLFTNGKTSDIALVLKNESDVAKPASDCYITTIFFEVSSKAHLDELKVGDVRVVNNTKKIEAIMGKSTFSEVENKFGLHYTPVAADELYYRPDTNSDGIVDLNDDIFPKQGLSMGFNANTRILEVYEFHYWDEANL